MVAGADNFGIVAYCAEVAMKKTRIVFMASNPLDTDRLALDQEVHTIHVELERAGFGHCFELVTRWAARPLDLLRELRRLKPAIVHLSGHGHRGVAGGVPEPVQATPRDIVGAPGLARCSGVFAQGPDGRAQLIPTQALIEMFGAVGSSVELAVLSVCYSEAQAEALLEHVGAVVGTRGSILDAAAIHFAAGFYGGLGERESVASAFKQGCAAICLEGLPDSDRPQLKVRAGIDANQLVWPRLFRKKRA